jgi:hypothetical protein
MLYMLGMHCSSQLLCTIYASLTLVGRNPSRHYWVKCDADAAPLQHHLDLDLNPETLLNTKFFNLPDQRSRGPMNMILAARQKSSARAPADTIAETPNSNKARRRLSVPLPWDAGSLELTVRVRPDHFLLLPTPCTLTLLGGKDGKRILHSEAVLCWKAVSETLATDLI